VTTAPTAITPPPPSATPTLTGEHQTLVVLALTVIQLHEAEEGAQPPAQVPPVQVP
jgi:hypothetical protein